MARDHSPQDLDGEKANIDYVADVAHSEHVVDSQNDWQNEFTPQEQRSIMKRIDRRLVTTVGVMYCVSLMDRSVALLTHPACQISNMMFMRRNTFSLLNKILLTLAL